MRNVAKNDKLRSKGALPRIHHLVIQSPPKRRAQRGKGERQRPGLQGVRDEGERFPVGGAVDSEVSMIQGEDRSQALAFGDADGGRVGEVHGPFVILSHQGPNARDIVGGEIGDAKPAWNARDPGTPPLLAVRAMRVSTARPLDSLTS